MARSNPRAEQWKQRTRTPKLRPPDTYATRAKAPLHILAFLAPLIVLYEIGSILYLRQGALQTDPNQVQDIKARRLLADLFDTLGTSGLVLPAVLLVAILILQHILRRDKAHIHPKTLAIMWLEAAAWTLPLLVLGQLLFRLLGGDAPLTNPDPLAATQAALEPTTSATLLALPLGARITIAIGAGLYEELVFRLIGLAALHLLLHDVIRLPKQHAAAAALILTSIAFALYHAPAGGLISAHAGFYTAAGLFFGVLYITRGLGIAVAVHVLYDIAVLVIIPA